MRVRLPTDEEWQIAQRGIDLILGHSMHHNGLPECKWCQVARDWRKEEKNIL